MILVRLLRVVLACPSSTLLSIRSLVRSAVVGSASVVGAVTSVLSRSFICFTLCVPDN